MFYWNSSICLAHIVVTELYYFSVSQYFSVSMPIAKPSVVITNTHAQIFSICRSFGIMLSVVIELVLLGGRVLWQHQPACNAAENY
jgi:hypothetical protein